MHSFSSISIHALLSAFMATTTIIQPAVADVIVNNTITQGTNAHPATAPTSESKPPTQTIVVALAVVAFVLFCIFFLMVNLYKKPFGDRFRLRTPNVLLGTNQPFEDLASTAELGNRAITLPARAAFAWGRDRATNTL